MWKIVLVVVGLGVVTAVGAGIVKQRGLGDNCNEWNITGKWVVDHQYNGNNNYHDMIINKSLWNNSYHGEGGNPSGNTYTYEWKIDNLTLVGDEFQITATYFRGAPNTILEMNGIINPDGSLSGQWSDNLNGSHRQGLLTSVSGPAKKKCGIFSNPQPSPFPVPMRQQDVYY